MSAATRNVGALPCGDPPAVAASFFSFAASEEISPSSRALDCTTASLRISAALGLSSGLTARHLWMIVATSPEKPLTGLNFPPTIF